MKADEVNSDVGFLPLNELQQHNLHLVPWSSSLKSYCLAAVFRSLQPSACCDDHGTVWSLLSQSNCDSFTFTSTYASDAPNTSFQPLVEMPRRPAEREKEY